MAHAVPGPLNGVRVLEVGGMGPGPFAGMTMADMGAEVVRVERPGGLGVFPGEPRQDMLNRGKRSAALDLKSPSAVAALLAMVERADVLIEGHRPGVAERLGIGPDHCHARNPRLVYGRMTGWGQEGPFSHKAGHDIDYIAITGVLHAIGDAGGPPQIPLNVLGNLGGGATYLVMGVLAALLEAGRTGKGRVIDAAVVDGAAHLLSGMYGMVNAGAWIDERGVNLVDGGAPYYAVYETSDGRYMAVGAIEGAFYVHLLAGLEVEGVDSADQNATDTWPRTKATFRQAFARRTQAEWIDVFDRTDACVAPVLSLHEAMNHPHLKERGTVLTRGGLLQAAPAPRFSDVPVTIGASPPTIGQHTREVLLDWGVDPDPLLATGAAHDASP